jgi:hypothetical protein
VGGVVAKTLSRIAKDVTDLREQTGKSNGDTIYLVSYFPDSSAGGGVFRWDASSTEADDNGIIIAPTGVTTGRWKRQHDGGVYAEWFGAVGDGDINKASQNIQAIRNARDASAREGGRSLYFGSGIFYVDGNLQIGRSLGNEFDSFKISGTGDSTNFKVVGDSVTFLDMNCALYCEIDNIRIDLEGANQIAIAIHSDYVDTDPAVAFAQFNRFISVRVEAPSAPMGTLALRMDRTLTNVFYGCWFLRTYQGVRFGDAVDADPVNGSHFCNANNFYGCEIRSNSAAYLGQPDNRLFIHNSGVGNVWHAGVLENANKASQMYGGTLVFDGTYWEGFADGAFVITYGGELSIVKCYWNANAIFMRTASKVNFIGNFVDYSSGPSPFVRNYPVIQFTLDEPYELKCRDNIMMKPDIELYRQFEWRNLDTNVFSPLSDFDKIDVQADQSKFLLRLNSPLLDVTGDGTSYTVDWNTADRFYDLNKEFDFTNNRHVVKQDGYYSYSANVTLSSVPAGASITVNLVTPSRKYRLVSGSFETSSGFASANGSVEGVRMFKGEFAEIEVIVSGGAKVVDIDSGADAQTYFSGQKVI